MSDGWKLIDSAPRDRIVWCCDDRLRYSAKMAMNEAGEWECLDYDDGWMNVGFYPTHWRELPALPVSPAKEGNQ